MEGFRTQDKGARAPPSPESGINQGTAWGGGWGREGRLLHELRLPHRGRWVLGRLWVGRRLWVGTRLSGPSEDVATEVGEQIGRAHV